MCRGMNAELISINHPDLTNELRTHLVDPDAIGTYTFKHKIDKLLIYNLNLLSIIQLHDSIVVSIPACHAGDRGSIPRRGVSFF